MTSAPDNDSKFISAFQERVMNSYFSSVDCFADSEPMKIDRCFARYDVIG